VTSEPETPLDKANREFAEEMARQQRIHVQDLRDLATTYDVMRSEESRVKRLKDAAGAKLKQELMLRLENTSSPNDLDRKEDGTPFVYDPETGVVGGLQRMRPLEADIADAAERGHADLIIAAAKAGALKLDVTVFRALEKLPWARELRERGFVYEGESYQLDVKRQGDK
jgi:hypothetical protein